MILQQDIVAMYLFNGADEATFKRRLEQQIELRVERIAQVVDLEVTQLEKLRLAAHGDLSRFYRELGHVREKTKGLNQQNQQEMQQAWQHISPLQSRLSEGIINQNSLTERILATLLTDEQQAKYDVYLSERNQARLRAVIALAIVDVEKVVPLTERQRTELIKLLNANALKHELFFNHRYPYFGFVLLAKLTDEELTPLLDEQQQKALRQLTKPYEGMPLNF